MKISYSWLKDYIEIPDDPESLSEILTNLGLEVEGMEKIESIPGGLEGLVVGHVVACMKHPNADRLTLTKVDVGNGSILPIVCGAPNVAEGQKVPVAKVGTTLYPYDGEPFKIKKGKIRGEVSEGMICAEDEIGIGSDHSGIMVLPGDLEVGTPLSEHIKVETDYVYDIGLTPNRSDATSHIGVARDLAAHYSFKYDKEWPLNLPQTPDLATIEAPPVIDVVLEDTEGCPRYSGISLSGVTIGDSPAWMQWRLRAVDVRPINNIVDITNYVLHEFGQPLHAFDQSKIEGNKIIVKNLSSGTLFKSLDGLDRKLGAEDLMICNGKEKGMCIAGVYGGIDSGVTDITTDIFLESAHFNATRIRKTSMSHLLRTDAAKCFEKGTDPNITVAALSRAVDLITSFAEANIQSRLVDEYPQPIRPTSVKVRLDRINTLVGNTLSKKEVENLFKALRMTSNSDGNVFTVQVPTDKADVTREIDVIEEILRIYGFNNVQTEDRINTSVAIQSDVDRYGLSRKLKEFLVGRGYNEMMGLSLIESKLYTGPLKGWTDKIIHINNTSNIHLDAMRPEMMMSMLLSVAYNHNRQQTNLRLFEVGAAYNSENGDIKEHQVLGLVVTGDEERDSWLVKRESASFYTIKRTVVEILDRLGIDRYQVSELNDERFSGGLLFHNGPNELSRLGIASASMRGQAGVKGEVYYAEMMLDPLLSRHQKNQVVVSEIPKYPSVRRDLALVMDQKTRYDRLEEVVRRAGGSILDEITLFDVYIDDDLKHVGKKSYAIALTFVDKEKSLRDKDVDKVVERILGRCKSQLGAVIR